MRAAILYEAGKPLVVEEGVTVDAPLRGEIKVRIAATAVCHSDLHFIKGDIPAKLPGLAGHETAGYVEEVGEGVADFKPGDAVVLGTVTSGCGHCYYCTIGLRHFCLNRQAIAPGQVHHSNRAGQRLGTLAGPVGGFAEYTTVSQTVATRIPAGMPLDRAALLACGVSTGFGAVVNRARVNPLDSVVVIGAGGVGLNSIQAARYAGASPVIAIDIRDSKLEIAEKFGATGTINVQDEKDPVKKVFEMTEGRGADFAFVTVGDVQAIRQGFSMCGPRGMTVVIGLVMGNLASIMPIELVMSEKILTGCGGGSLRTSIDIPHLVTLYQSGRLKLDELISGHYPLEKINDAVESLAAGEALRNVIMMG